MTSNGSLDFWGLSGYHCAPSPTLMVPHVGCMVMGNLIRHPRQTEICLGCKYGTAAISHASRDQLGGHLCQNRSIQDMRATVAHNGICIRIRDILRLNYLLGFMYDLDGVFPRTYHDGNPSGVSLVSIELEALVAAGQESAVICLAFVALGHSLLTWGTNSKDVHLIITSANLQQNPCLGRRIRYIPHAKHQAFHVPHAAIRLALKRPPREQAANEAHTESRRH
ncbi:hypothetical protein H4582DRAFT_2055293 [Lactarius indigo]|nr:hypothetical protein H4582DRAFT_2055293 [Lactarius indigo]